MNSAKDFPLLSLFEMPFPVWRHACKVGRKNIAKHLPPGQSLPELSEEDYRLWYARYLNHIAKNYHEFLEGIMSGFPEPQYPPEVEDMIINYKIKMSMNPRDAASDGMFPPSSSNRVKQELDDGEMYSIGKDRSGNAVVIEYGHNQDSNLDTRKRKIEEELLHLHQAKQCRIEFDRRLSRDSAPGSSYTNGSPGPGKPGFAFKCEDEFKYKVKSLILYYLDKTLVEKGLVDPITKRAKVPETILPNPYVPPKPTQIPISFDVNSPISATDRDLDPRERKHFVRESSGSIFDRLDRFQRSRSNSGSERSINIVRSSRESRDRDRDNYRSGTRRIQSSADRNRSRRGREKLPDNDVSTTVAALNPKSGSSCPKCRKGEECWEC